MADRKHLSIGKSTGAISRRETSGIPARHKQFSIQMILNNDREEFGDESLSDPSQQQHIKITPNTSQGREPQARQYSQSENAAHFKMSGSDGQNQPSDDRDNLEETRAVPQKLTQRHTSCPSQTEGVVESPVAQTNNSCNPPPLPLDQKSSLSMRRCTDNGHTATPNAKASRRFRARRVEYVQGLENTVCEQRVLIEQLREQIACYRHTLSQLQHLRQY